MRRLRNVLACAVVLMTVCASAFAYIDAVVSSDFELGDEGWTSWTFPAHGGPSGTLTPSATTLDGENALGVTSIAGTGASDYIGTQSAEWQQDFSTLIGQAFISFSFYTSSQVVGQPWPADLRLYFIGNGVEWQYSFDETTLSQGWNSLSASLVRDQATTDWVAPLLLGGDDTDFENSLANLTEIGLIVGYQNSPGETYGLDNFQIGMNIPEPGTYAALGFALVSLGITFRGRVKELFKGPEKKS